jgi:hypothetical protein
LAKVLKKEKENIFPEIFLQQLTVAFYGILLQDTEYM